MLVLRELQRRFPGDFASVRWCAKCDAVSRWALQIGFPWQQPPERPAASAALASQGTWMHQIRGQTRPVHGVQRLPRLEPAMGSTARHARGCNAVSPAFRDRRLEREQHAFQRSARLARPRALSSVLGSHSCMAACMQRSAAHVHACFRERKPRSDALDAAEASAAASTLQVGGKRKQPEEEEEEAG